MSPEVFAPAIAIRYRYECQRKRAMLLAETFLDRDHVERYASASGYYGKDFIFETLGSRIPVEKDIGLYGNEIVLYQALLSLLKEQKNGDGPVVFVDYGGGYGVTAARLAVHFKKEILSDQLIIIVTNLALDPQKRIEHQVERADIKFDAKAFAAYSQGVPLVQFIHANAPTLLRATINSFGGKKIPLRQSADLVHLRNVLINSVTPDSDLLNLSRCLSPRGILMIGDVIMGTSSLIPPEFEELQEIAFQKGLFNLADVGAQKILGPHNFSQLDVEYFIYAMGQAPNLRNLPVLSSYRDKFESE